MSMAIVYSNGALTDADGEVSWNHHTYEVNIAAKDTNHWIEVRLNGGPWSIWIPPEDNQSHAYVTIRGDYTKMQIITAASTVSVFAIG